MTSRRIRRLRLAALVALPAAGLAVAGALAATPSRPDLAAAPVRTTPPGPVDSRSPFGVGSTSSSLGLALAPASATVSPGTAAVIGVTIERTRFAAPVALAVAGLPRGASAALTPVVTTTSASSLRISTAGTTPAGSYQLAVTASASGATATATMTLVVAAPGVKTFALSGTLDRALAPGVTGSLDVSITNPNAQDIQVTSIDLTVTGTNTPGCTPDDFSTTAYTGATLTVPGRATRSLSGLGVPVPARPTITLVDRPTNQDACRRAVLTLALTGKGHS
ncbi:MAG: hypothetical protein ACTHMS_12950 [Jatrophihabitans sp.]|uniref:hypothetical protein n=1 Tax=Jatrophihabitans sp. TaxID=1932789 RepID=UPI003F7ED702